MRLFTIIGPGVALTALLAVGCGGERAASEPPSYQELKQEELASERQEYLRETRQELSEVDREIQHLEAKLQHEKQFVDASRQASWSQELFELRQEKQQLEARLERAQQASPEEWEQMRSQIGGAVDSLQAGVKKVQAEVSQALALRDDEGAQDRSQAAVAAESGLCPVEVAGAEARVEEQGDRVLVTITTSDQQNVPELQRRANQLAKNLESYSPARSVAEQPSAPEQAEPDQPKSSQKQPKKQQMQVDVTAQNLKDGVKLEFKPKGVDVETLRAQLEKDAEQLTQGRCQAPATVSMRSKAE